MNHDSQMVALIDESTCLLKWAVEEGVTDADREFKLQVRSGEVKGVNEVVVNLRVIEVVGDFGRFVTSYVREDAAGQYVDALSFSLLHVI